MPLQITGQKDPAGSQPESPSLMTAKVAKDLATVMVVGSLKSGSDEGSVRQRRRHFLSDRCIRPRFPGNEGVASRKHRVKCHCPFPNFRLPRHRLRAVGFSNVFPMVLFVL